MKNEEQLLGEMVINDTENLERLMEKIDYAEKVLDKNDGKMQGILKRVIDYHQDLCDGDCCPITLCFD